MWFVKNVEFKQRVGVACKDESHHADVSRTDDPKFGPGKHESELGMEGTRQKDVVTAILRVRGCQFNVTEGSQKRNHAPE